MFTATEPVSHEVIGACPHDCPDTCSMVTTVRDGVAIKVQGNPAHPQTGGAAWKMAPSITHPFELVDNLIFDGLLRIARDKYALAPA